MDLAHPVTGGAILDDEDPASLDTAAPARRSGAARMTPRFGGPGDQSRTLPLLARPEVQASGVLIRLPVRREEVQVERRAFIAEEVVVYARELPDVVRQEATVRREDLVVDTLGDLEATRPLGPAGRAGEVPIERPHRPPR